MERVRLLLHVPVRVCVGATWLSLRDDEDDPGSDGPVPTFGFGEAPVSEDAWEEPSIDSPGGVQHLLGRPAWDTCGTQPRSSEKLWQTLWIEMVDARKRPALTSVGGLEGSNSVEILEATGPIADCEPSMCRATRVAGSRER